MIGLGALPYATGMTFAVVHNRTYATLREPFSFMKTMLYLEARVDYLMVLLWEMDGTFVRFFLKVLTDYLAIR